jgi:hypothetical protein
MNITIVVEVMVSALIMATFLMPLLEAPAMALGPSGKCYVDCTCGGIPSNVREHNVCLTACIFGEGVQRLDEGFLPPQPLPSDRPRGQQTGRK